jgi:uncharacterized membrane protein YozB (DUF420 family)
MHRVFPAAATLGANVNLAAQLALVAALTVGVILARKKRFRAHKFVQSSAVLFNLVMIGTVMLPSSRRLEFPLRPAAFRHAYYTVAVVHALLGSVAELLGLYVVLRAGTNRLPQRLRFQNYKPWMRAALVFWWLVAILGVGVYYLWYVA